MSNKFEHEVKDKEERHPSYCLAQFTRTTGCADLFGTNIRPQHFFTFKLQQAVKVVQWTGEENFRPDYGGKYLRNIIEFSLSANQFAEMITTMNIGEGIPVTLTYDHGKKVEDCPKQSSAIVNVIETASKQVLEEESDLLEKIDEALALLEKKSLTKEDKKAIAEALSGNVGRLKETGKFYGKQVKEVGEKLKQEIRTEIDAYATQAVNKVGLMALGNEKAINALLEKIPNTKDENDTSRG